MTTSIEQRYTKDVIPAMQKEFGYAHVLAVPRIKKVVVNIGVGKNGKEKWYHEEVIKYLTLITGQKPSPRPARKSIAIFKLREGQIVGYKTTLRGKRMYDFLERLVSSAIPRTRDFRGLDPKAVDAGGNITLGIKEHIIFPEVIGEETKTIFGLEITIVTSAETREKADKLIRLLGFPLKKVEEK